MGRRIRTSAILLSIFFAFGLFFALNVHAFRCGDEIVGTGDSKARVLIKCGKPMFQERVGAKVSTRRN